MTQGVFVKGMPFIGIAVAWNRASRHSIFLLDTGFSGDLQVTPGVARELGLEIVAVTSITIATGQTVQMQTALAVVEMEGATNSVTVQVSEGLPLAGIGLLTKFGYSATVDCKNKSVALERVS